MKIALFSDTYLPDINGVATSTNILRNELVRLGHDVLVVTSELPSDSDYDINLDNHNIEQLSAKLLFDLTRNTGFIVSKSDLGECWQQNCCEWTRRQEDDICGLDHTKLTLNQKMKHIYLGTSLQNEFKNVGLGALI